MDPPVVKVNSPSLSKFIKEVINILQALEKKVDSEKLKLLKDKLTDDIQKPFDSAEKIIADKLEKVTTEVSNKTKGKENEKNDSNLKFQRLDFEKFKGDIRDYPSWKNDFEKHISPRYPESEQSLVLKNNLCDEVNQEIKHFSDIKDIWVYLDERDGDERKFMDKVMHQVRNLKKCDDNNPKYIVEFIVTIEKANKDFSALKLEPHLNNYIMMSEIERKFYTIMACEWSKLVTGDLENNAKTEPFSVLLKFLRAFRKRMEYNIDKAETDGSVPSERSHGLLHGGQQQRQPGQGLLRVKCHFCDQLGHVAYHCDRMEKMSLDERIKVMIEKKLCSRCFCPKHEMKDCTKFGDRYCNVDSCKGRHSRYLHGASVGGFSAHTGLLSNENQEDCNGCGLYSSY